MRITFVLPPVGLSGGVRVVGIYAKALALRGHKVVLVSPPHPMPKLRTRIWSALTGRGWLKHEAQSHLDGSGLDHRVLESERPVGNADVPDGDVVIATWWETAEWVHQLSAEKGAKVYFVQHHEVFPHLPIARSQATYRMPMHKIVVARWLKKVMADTYGDVDVDVIPNSVDRHQFFPTGERSKQVIPTVGFLYSTVAFKGVNAALAALALVRKQVGELRILCFGSRLPHTDLPLPDNAEFHFAPAQQEIRGIYSRCDVWLTASRSEGFNLPAMEAMACGTPVVATRAGWPEEAIRNHSNGVLVDVDDVTALAEGIRNIISLSPADWKQMSDCALATARQGSWQASAEQFEHALQRACEWSKLRHIHGRSEGPFPFAE